MTGQVDTLQASGGHSIGWLLRYVLRRWTAMALVIVMMVLNIGVDLLKPWPMKVLVDSALKQQNGSDSVTRLVRMLPGSEARPTLVLWCVLATITLFAVGWVISTVSSVTTINFGQRVAYDVAADVFQHLQKLSLAFHARKSTGDTIRRVLVDSAALSSIAKDALLPALASLLLLAGMLLVMLRLDWQLTLVAIVVAPYLMWVLRRYAAPMMQGSYRQQETEGRLYTLVEQTLTSLPVIHAFTREEYTEDLFRRRTNEAYVGALALTHIQVKFTLFVRLGTAIGTAGIMWIGAREVLEARLSVGTLLVFLSYLASLYAPMESLAYTSSTLRFALGGARRVRELLDEAPEVREAAGAAAIQVARGEVVMQGVSYGYDSDRPVLKDISLHARPGQLVAIVGPTGAGKTTLLAMIPRFFDPWSGAVLLDGRDVSGVRLADLRRQFALVLQEPLLFPLTIAQNIAYGRPDASREQVVAAATAARAHEFISALPQGYDTVVGERGATLSGGQRQRISIARALLKDAPVLLMDEPTSALDAQTERELTDAIGSLVYRRTTFVIAHRLSTIRNADQIIVMDHGEIVQRGTHDELVRAGGLYGRMYQAFAGGGSEAPT